MWLRTVKGGNQDPKLPRGNERGADSTTTNTPGAAPNMVPYIKDSLVSQWINQGLYSGLPQVCTWGGGLTSPAVADTLRWDPNTIQCWAAFTQQIKLVADSLATPGDQPA